MDSLSHRAPEKQCPACAQFFPATTEFFYKNARAKDGLCWMCKTCQNTARRQYPNHGYAPKNRPPMQKLFVRKRTNSLIDSFWSKVDKSGDCWLWTGRLHNHGYGMFRDGRYKYAHRTSYILAYGDIPDGLFICHRCNNPRCVNPAHLYAGTPQDNTNDMYAAGRAKPPSVKGEANGNSKLTESQVREIRKKHQEKHSITKLAREYGLDNSTVCDIIKYRTWKHIQ